MSEWIMVTSEGAASEERIDRFDEEMNAPGEKMEALIDVVERYISNRNGGKLSV